MFLYLAVSKSAVNGALIREDEGNPEADVLHQPFHEWTTNQIPKTGKVDARSLHHLEEAQALLSNLPDHGHHGASFEKCYSEPRSNRTDIKMGIRAEALWTQIKPRTVIKGQVLADFIADFTPEATKQYV